MNYTARFNPHATTPAAVSGASVLRQFAVLLARAFALSGPHKPLGQSAAARQALNKGSTIWMDRPLARTVVCETGTVWLTHDGQAKDVILEAGQSHCCDSNARLGIHALAGSTVTTV